MRERSMPSDDRYELEAAVSIISVDYGLDADERNRAIWEIVGQANPSSLHYICRNCKKPVSIETSLSYKGFERYCDNCVIEKFGNISNYFSSMYKKYENVDDNDIPIVDFNI